MEREGETSAVALDLSEMLSNRQQHDDAARPLVSLAFPLILCLCVRIY